MEPYYDVVTLQTYVDVDPVNARGENLMDAGRLVFKEAGLNWVNLGRNLS